MHEQLIYIRHLLSEQSSRRLTEPEAQILEEWISRHPDHRVLIDQFRDAKWIADRLEQFDGYDLARSRARFTAALKTTITTEVPPVRSTGFFKRSWFRYAAVLLLIAGTVIYVYKVNQPIHREIVQHSITTDTYIPPGRNRALLTLADGSKIVLDSAADGTLAKQGNTEIQKLNAGSLAYHPTKQLMPGGEVLYNTISTPKGGQYQITLPDGSKVWLNAASSIQFPTVFVKERKVTVTGEAYLEIAADRQKPFYVLAGNITVQVLGTSFNLNAYLNEPAISTTLEEGAVRVSANNHSQTLNPGEQVQVKPDGLLQLIQHADLQKVMAWKNGQFNFNGAALPEVMRQVERWYDIEVVYEKEVPTIQFVGKMSKGVPLSDLLDALKSFGVHFKMHGRRLVVLSGSGMKQQQE